MFNLQNNLANVNSNAIALRQGVTTLGEKKQVSMNFYIKSWSQDNLGSEIDYFKKLFAQCMKWILYHFQLNTPLQACRRLRLSAEKASFSELRPAGGSEVHLGKERFTEINGRYPSMPNTALLFCKMTKGLHVLTTGPTCIFYRI